MVEVLIVATIFAIVGTAIAASFMSGMKIWNRLKYANFAQNNALLQLEIIAKELRQKVDISLIEAKGSKNEITFATIINDSIFKLTYEFDSSRKILFKEKTAFQDIVGKEEPYISSRNKAVLLDDFSLSYLKSSQTKFKSSWDNNWDNEAEELIAVRIKIKVANKEFTKTIFIPTAN